MESKLLSGVSPPSTMPRRTLTAIIALLASDAGLGIAYLCWAYKIVQVTEPGQTGYESDPSRN